MDWSDFLWVPLGIGFFWMWRRRGMPVPGRNWVLASVVVGLAIGAIAWPFLARAGAQHPWLLLVALPTLPILVVLLWVWFGGAEEHARRGTRERGRP